MPSHSYGLVKTWVFQPGAVVTLPANTVLKPGTKAVSLVDSVQPILMVKPL